ncbi:uncharacterized protein [Mytilus edulis]|uniref:uncharacterized protein n=1 Tax=Mytilus edulis TaxID=6550 RepID=UPI0039EEEA0A
MIKFFLWIVIFQTVLILNKFLCIGSLDCELGWELRRGRCYRLMRSSSHTNGVQLCNNVNGLLIMPMTAEENSTAIELLQLWSLKRMWIGLSNTNENNEYTWEDGTKLIDTGYTSWRQGEPNGGDEPMCVEAHLGGWNDNPCHKSFPVVCQQVEDITNKIKENESVTLSCEVKDMQAITSLFWTRSVYGTSVIVSQYAKGGNVTSPSLVFEHVKWTDEGLYTCHVTYISGMTQTEEANLFVDATNMCPCRCDYRRKLEHWGSKIVPNLTREELVIELESELQIIEKKLTVNKTQLSSSIRKLTSAPDKRESSERIGLAGAAFMCFVVGLVLLIDVLKFVKFVKSTITF